jgi:phosphatidylserine decarboxylase
MMFFLENQSNEQQRPSRRIIHNLLAVMCCSQQQQQQQIDGGDYDDVRKNKSYHRHNRSERGDTQSNKTHCTTGSNNMFLCHYHFYQEHRSCDHRLESVREIYQFYSCDNNNNNSNNNVKNERAFAIFRQGHEQRFDKACGKACGTSSIPGKWTS